MNDKVSHGVGNVRDYEKEERREVGVHKKVLMSQRFPPEIWNLWQRSSRFC
jgi:hypothetical protein